MTHPGRVLIAVAATTGVLVAATLLAEPGARLLAPLTGVAVSAVAARHHTWVVESVAVSAEAARAPELVARGLVLDRPGDFSSGARVRARVSVGAAVEMPCVFAIVWLLWPGAPRARIAALLVGLALALACDVVVLSAMLLDGFVAGERALAGRDDLTGPLAWFSGFLESGGRSALALVLAVATLTLIPAQRASEGTTQPVDRPVARGSA